MMTKVSEEIHPHRPEGKALEYFEGLRCLYPHGAQTSNPRSRDFWQLATVVIEQRADCGCGQTGTSRRRDVDIPWAC
jgi:hypothetical protein